MTGPEKAAAFAARKSGGAPLSMLTAYDYPTARLFDDGGVDSLLVGDSLGMVVLGFPDTTHVKFEHMLHHVAAVGRAETRALVIGDFSIGTYPDPETAVANARLLVAAGADAVKLEGGVAQAEKVRAIIAAGIPVCGHLGMLPQSVLEEGGYKKKGKTIEQSDALLQDALALVEAGAFAVVLESVVPAAAARITREIPIPTIGIGCGEGNCDGEVCVATDLLGTFPWFVPPFARPEADLAPQIIAAAKAYVARQTRL